MFWAGLGCLNIFVNSVLFSHTAQNIAPVWCDISTRIMIAQSIGIPAASLCINRRLYYIASLKSTSLTRSEKRRGIMIDLAIGLGLPLLELPLAYVNQGHRFDIYEQVGCMPDTYGTPMALMLMWIWPIVIGLVSAFYCYRSIRIFNKRRSEFNDLLSANSNLNSNRYFRLMFLAGLDLCTTIPIAVYMIFLNTQFGLDPWISWSDTHFDFSRIGQFPALIWQNNPTIKVAMYLSRGLTIACAFIFFMFFGFAAEARKNYKKVYVSVTHVFGGTSTRSAETSSLHTRSSKTSSLGKLSLPILIHKETIYATDRGRASSMYQKSNVSISSLFDRVKVKFPSSTSPRSTSQGSRSSSPAPPVPTKIPPPSYYPDAPTNV